MAKEKLPKQFLQLKKRHEKYFDAVEELGKVVKQEGPLDEKTAQLIQLAAAATEHSEGAVHSHVRRALVAGVTPKEIYHAMILLTSTIGFPNVVAALSWADDIIQNKKG
ncbi:MAG: carboxymuconolactone decarboxylase family protein [Planctomycetia bacterium]|nr:carboxymuconolactone decarboxylase family protein [Planctomycetia bacterium]